MMKDKTCKVFVYGTLKVGGHFATRFDHVRLSSRPVSINGCMFSVQDRFPTVDFTKDGTVIGEVHEYDQPNHVIAMMDQIEGYGGEDVVDNLYNRVTIQVPSENGGVEEVIAYSFNGNTEQFAAVDSGEWDIRR